MSKQKIHLIRISKGVVCLDFFENLGKYKIKVSVKLPSAKRIMHGFIIIRKSKKMLKILNKNLIFKLFKLKKLKNLTEIDKSLFLNRLTTTKH